ncbi:MAG: hypothetical protein EOO65_02390 [Methanosarcinales archaeon]|nr:MAG: hypothetical protein EOO65_02390 [Methanosarcinales archaeon]
MIPRASFSLVRCFRAHLQLVGPPRVWLKTAPFPGLNMSRSYGDVIGKQAGVISVPHRTAQALAPSDQVLILGSDGVSFCLPTAYLVRHEEEDCSAHPPCFALTCSSGTG